MSSLMIAQDPNLLMIEVMVNKLFVPSATRFDDVVLSKSIVSFRFLDDEWTDITPNRKDYRKYRGSAGEQQCFYGGKSVVFSVPSSVLTEESEDSSSEESSSSSSSSSGSSYTGKCLEIAVRREISPYFAVDKHVCEFGRQWINVCELFNGIVKELQSRRELDGYLTLAHERDPISRSTKGHYSLENPDNCEPTGCHLDIYVRLSYLGSCVITEIDRPLPSDSSAPFYAQEETNLAPPYECIELDAERVAPKCKVPVLTQARCHDLRCECTDEQRYRLMLAENMRNAETCPMQTDEGDDGKDKGKKGKKKGKKEKKTDQSTCTGADTDDKSCATDIVCKMGEVAKDGKCEPKRKPKTMLTAEDLANLLAMNRRGASISVGIVDKPKPCEPCVPCCVIEPCVDVCPRPVCPPSYPCPPPVCCYD